jgi:hypothetical protein
MVDIKLLIDKIKAYAKNPFRFIAENVDDEKTCFAFLVNFIRINAIVSFIGDLFEFYFTSKRNFGSISLKHIVDELSTDVILTILVFVFAKYIARFSLYIGILFMKFAVTQVCNSFNRVAAIRLIAYQQIVFLIPTIGLDFFDITLLSLQFMLLVPLSVYGNARQFNTTMKNGFYITLVLMIIALVFLGILFGIIYLTYLALCAVKEGKG